MPAEVNPETPTARPWYREPLAWMVFAIPALAVVGGAVLLVLAFASWDGLVADDYYRRGMQINRSLARDATASRLGLRAAVRFPGADAIEVRLNDATSAGGGLILHLAHATREGADLRLDMQRTAHGVWRAALPPLSPGKWYLEVGNERWRLSAPLWLPVEAEEIAISARPAGE